MRTTLLCLNNFIIIGIINDASVHLDMVTRMLGSEGLKVKVINFGLTRIVVGSQKEECAIDSKNTFILFDGCLLYTSPSPRDLSTPSMPSSA